MTLPSRVPEHGDFVNRPSAANRSSLRYGPFELLLQFHVRKARVRILIAGKNYKCNLRKPAPSTEAYLKEFKTYHSAIVAEYHIA